MVRRRKSQSEEESRERPWLLPLVCAALWSASVVSALGVVYATFETRQATQQLEELRREAGVLQVNAGKYLLEKSALAAYTRVESEAQTQLDMVVPALEELEMVRR